MGFLLIFIWVLPAQSLRIVDDMGLMNQFQQGEKPRIINFWATWCPPCKEEMPTLEAYFDAHRQDGFVIVAIEDGEPLEEVSAFVKDYGLTFPVWPDPKWVATTAFKTDNLPTSFVIDRTGIVRLTWTGAISRDVLEKYVTPLLKE